MDNNFFLSLDCCCYYSLDAEIVVYDKEDNRTLLLTDLLATIYGKIKALENFSRFSLDILLSQLQADALQIEPVSLGLGLDQLLELKLIKLA